MGSSILSEVDDTSILRTGLPTCYWRPLNWLPASRLLRPRSGLERSDFVLWPDSADLRAATSRPLSGVVPAYDDVVGMAQCVQVSRNAGMTVLPRGRAVGVREAEQPAQLTRGQPLGGGAAEEQPAFLRRRLRIVARPSRLTTLPLRRIRMARSRPGSVAVKVKFRL